MTWYTAKFQDKGAGRNTQVFYVEGRNEPSARERAMKHCSNDMDPESIKLMKLSKTLTEIKKGLLRGGYNRAITEEDEVLRRSDINSDNF